MRDFFERQDAARASTRRLVVLFLLAVVGTVLAVYLAAVLILAWGGSDRGLTVSGILLHLWNPAVFLWAGGATVGLIGIGSLVKTASLRAGGSAVASLLGGREVDPATQDPRERRLLNVVEEMAIASGMPVPAVYVLGLEDGINAFAAGFDTGDAAVAVTRGTLEKLSRDELQGVIAHEFSHIAHGDMRLNVRLMGWVFGILLLGLAGRLILQSVRFRGSSRKKGGGGAILLFALALLVIGYIGFFFTRLIKSAVSRQREFLADAAAVQYTRNPRGLAGALAKIADAGSKLDHPRAEEASHLFFANGLQAQWLSWMATHPPLEERIRRLDPDGIYLGSRAAEEAVPTPPPAPEEAAPAALGLAGAEGKSTEPAYVPELPVPGPAESVTDTAADSVAGSLADPEVWLARAGQPNPESLAVTAEVLRALPAPLYHAAHDTTRAQAVIYALLLDPDPEVRRRQQRRLDERAPDVRREVAALAPEVVESPAATRLPLVDLTLPALRRLSRDSHQQFRETVRALAEEDGKTDLFELMLERVLLRHLDRHFEPDPTSNAPRHRSLKGLGGACSTLLSALAHYGHAEAARAKEAFEAAAAELEGSGARLELRPDWEADLTAVGEALDELSGVAPKLGRQLVKGAIRAVLYDGEVTLEEAEMLRAVADGLGCPVPPMRVGAAPDPRGRASI